MEILFFIYILKFINVTLIVCSLMAILLKYWPPQFVFQNVFYLYINTFIFFSFHSFIFIFYCCWVTVAPIFPHYSPPPYLPPHPTLDPLPHCLCPWVHYTWSLRSFPFFPPLSPFRLNLWLQLVCSFLCLWFYFAHLFCSLSSTYRWGDIVFAFYYLAYFT